ncbi:MAG TPA: glycosyltransferase [Pyrinomonadaceae bacterium]|nr:glycosyltransferase [Pyrinomonadaceae bacterium]
MRVLLTSKHRYPAFSQFGAGRSPRKFPSGSAFFIHDLLAKGLAELGHEVFYLLPEGADTSLPVGVTLVSEARQEVDIIHTITFRDEGLSPELQALSKPWVTTCHLDLNARGLERSPPMANWIFVSRTLAELHGRSRYVLNGIDPSDYIYSEVKEPYFLFMSTVDWGTQKGLDVVLSLSRQLGFKLVVAGTGKDYESINRVAAMCHEFNAEYVGDVKGTEKAKLLAGAKAFLFPTKVAEAFGLGMVEALMSGTPVICSDRGACPEIISADVGFVCRDETEFVAAIRKVGEISARGCREKAMRDYHYLRMASDYVIEYEKEISANGSKQRQVRSGTP